MKLLFLSMLTAPLLLLGGCANRAAAGAGEDIVHGSVGVRIQSQDTSRFAPTRSPL